MTLRTGLKAFAWGLLPLVALGVVVSLLGWRSVAPVPLAEGVPSEETVRARVGLLRQWLPAGSFTVLGAEPFVVIAELPEADAKVYAERARSLVAEYKGGIFARDPHTVTDVWLFADTESYKAGVRDLLEEYPRSLAGFYSPNKRAVVVNLAARSETLAHEIVHPYLAANYPELPAWVDEGLAALFERTETTSVGLAFLPGDRLPKLQQAVTEGTLPSIAAFTAGTDQDFYGDPKYNSYGHARYLMLFLESEGLLPSYLQKLEDARHTDATGYFALLYVTGSETGEELQVRWEAFVLSLTER